MIRSLSITMVDTMKLGVCMTPGEGRGAKNFHVSFGSRSSDHYFRSVCLFVCLSVQSFS